MANKDAIRHRAEHGSSARCRAQALSWMQELKNLSNAKLEKVGVIFLLQDLRLL